MNYKLQQIRREIGRPFVGLLLFVVTIILCSCTGRAQQPTPLKTIPIKSEVEAAEIIEKLEENPQDVELLISIWNYYLQTGDYTALIESASPVYYSAVKSEDNRLKAYAGTLLAQSFLFADNYDSLNYYINQVSDIVEIDGSGSLKCMLYNTEAIQALRMEMDYIKAAELFENALELSREAEQHTNVGMMLCNLASVDYYRSDSSGFKYVREAYEMSQTNQDKYVLSYATMLMASFSALVEDYDNAILYSKEYLAISNSPEQEYHKLLAHLQIGNIYSDMGEVDSAHYYLYKSLSYLDKSNSTQAIQALLSYGNFMVKEGRYQRAKETYEKGLALCEHNHNIKDWNLLLKALSNVYQKLGDKGSAIKYQKMALDHADSVFNIQKERMFYKMREQREKVEHQKSIQEKELHLVKAKRKMDIIVGALIIILVISISVFVLYRRTNRMYRRLVKQHQEHLQRDKEREIAKQNGAEAELSDEGNIDEQLFMQLENLMKEEKVYRNNDLSLDILAEMLNTNRTYISRAINQYAGVPFYEYINTRRIDEATQILSDTENDIPLKVLSDNLGYNSVSTFYRQFKKETGVPPSKYREIVKSIS